MLPNFQTTYEEDILLLCVFSYLCLRAINEKRKHISTDWQPVFITVFAGVIYVVVWMGLVHGYLELWGRWLTIFPAFLVAALYFKPEPLHSVSRNYHFLKSLLIIIMLVLFTSVWIAHKFRVPNEPVSPVLNAGQLIPPLIALPILGCILLLSRNFGSINLGINHLFLLLPAALVTGSVWLENTQTWYHWYMAGQLERAWTPFKYDDPEQIASAQKKPYEAVREYLIVHERITRKGQIPRYLNWPYFMKFRMAYQAMRKENPYHCIRLLNPRQIGQPDKIALLKNHIWHLDFLLDMQVSEPHFRKEQRIFVDYAMSPDRETAYVLDCFGRIYSYVQGTLWLEWEPPQHINDASQFTVYKKDAFIVRRNNGQYLVSKNILPFKLYDPSLPPGHEIIGMKSFHTTDAILLYTNYGEIIPYGNIPKGFPLNKPFSFNAPVIVDLELDLDKQGYYLLDMFGAIHSRHRQGSPLIPHISPPVPNQLLPYWANQNMAVDLELDPQGRGMYVYNRLGEVFSVAVNPYRETYRPSSTNSYRGVELGAFSDGSLYAFESNGDMVNIP